MVCSGCESVRVSQGYRWGTRELNKLGFPGIGLCSLPWNTRYYVCVAYDISDMLCHGMSVLCMSLGIHP